LKTSNPQKTNDKQIPRFNAQARQISLIGICVLFVI